MPSSVHKVPTAGVAVLLVGLLAYAACGMRYDGASMADGGLAEAELFDYLGLRFSGTCSFNATNGNLIVALTSGDSVIIGRSSTNAGEITINGNVFYCGNANYANVKDMNIFVTGGGTGSNETVVFDFENGYFAQSTGAATTGIWYDTGSSQDLDLLGIRMPNSSPPIGQNVTIGATGLHLHGTNVKDIAFQNNNPNVLTILMGPGDDRVNAAGDAQLAGSSLNGITRVYGNLGNDVIYTSGGNFNDFYYGNDGNDTIVVNSNAITSQMILSAGNSFETVSFAPRTAGVILTLSGNNAGP